MNAADASSPLALALAENHRAMPASAWSVPFKQASWTPAQIVEHVAITTDVAAGVVRGEGFGKLSVVDYVRFGAIHTVHHAEQLEGVRA